ncbi:MAG: RdgB/HAM1 family non-canonical purine NTP pyrophosphatase [Muribaculaceae bacterium]|nr:RdgB/HAM1 family non-canonical purine NTP pyrophosphatase [Muribaculaceae bacterium]
MSTIVFATNNANKLRELREMLGNEYRILGLADIGCTADIPETADSFEGNALLKGLYVLEHFGYACIADDSGLEVDALDGAPGIYSARYAGEGHGAAANNAKLLKELDGRTDRKARFRTAMVLVDSDGSHKTFFGTVEGSIGTEARGNAGFGYDPLFTPDGWTKTFAEAAPDEKNAVSHRGKAVRKLVEYLKSNNISSNIYD